MKSITELGHSYGLTVGFDLAHAIGNVPLSLHDWNCDFACWCSYKYLNSGPGAIAGCFVHQNHCHTDMSTPIDTESTQSSNRLTSHTTSCPHRLKGWWGQQLEKRFAMNDDFEPCLGAYGFRLSNPSVLLMVCLRASLDLFDQV